MLETNPEKSNPLLPVIVVAGEVPKYLTLTPFKVHVR